MTNTYHEYCDYSCTDVWYYTIQHRCGEIYNTTHVPMYGTTLYSTNVGEYILLHMYRYTVLYMTCVLHFKVLLVLRVLVFPLLVLMCSRCLPLLLPPDALPGILDSQTGWAFVNEGSEVKPKKGYVSDVPGSTLTFRVNTTRGGDRHKPIYLVIGYLKTYEKIGSAVLSCKAGCLCNSKLVNAHDPITRSSQTFLAQLSVSQVDQCLLSITVSPETTSGHHKFKITSLMMGDEQTSHPETSYLREGPAGLDIFFTDRATVIRP